MEKASMAGPASTPAAAAPTQGGLQRGATVQRALVSFGAMNVHRFADRVHRSPCQFQSLSTAMIKLAMASALVHIWA